MFSEKLLITDHRAGRNYAYSGGAVREICAGSLAEHAGILLLPAGAERGARWAFVDDRGGTVIVGGTRGELRVSAAIPAEHLASCAAGRYLAVSTGLGASTEPWSDVVTLVDLRSAESTRFRVRTGEPGIAVVTDQVTGADTVLLRHREPGAIEAIPLERILAAGAHVPTVRGESTTMIADDGHGDVYDPATGIFATATSRGLERFMVENAVPRPLGVIPWPVPGRAFYLRADVATGTAIGVVRGGSPAPEDWAEWTNTLVDIRLDSGETRHRELPPGLAFRCGSAAGRVAVAVIHPAGDAVGLLDRRDPRWGAGEWTALPAMTQPPIPGHAPWDSVPGRSAQRRSVALDPQGSTIAVSRGGDGEVHLIQAGSLSTIALPSALDEGGTLAWVPRDSAPETDLMGR